jgi:hypothetical protein
MMKQKILLLLLTLFSIVVHGQQFDSTYGKPLIVLIETDPWAMVMGSDVPSFALYENGKIIYQRIENKQLKIYEVTLSKLELQNVIRSLDIADSFYKLPNNIKASSWTDQPSNQLMLNFDSTKVISIYGKVRTDAEVRAATPKEFLTVYDNIKKYKSNSAKEWLPNKIEIMLWDYNYAPNKRPWIAGFPDLNSPTTVKRGDGEDAMYSLYIDKKDFEEFKKYYSSMGEKQAVEINGKKMAIDYRLPFPNLK